MQELQRHEVQDLIASGIQLVEVLASEEYEEDHLPGAINLPLRRIETDAAKRLGGRREPPRLTRRWRR